MTVEVNGQSALGRDKYLVTINALDTSSQRRDTQLAADSALSQSRIPRGRSNLLDRAGGRVKVPLFIQGGIHGNEFEGVDASMLLIERLATTPYGTDPEVDQILDQSIVLFNPIQNPDGRIAGQRANGNGFDLNRDFLTQSQPETLSSVAIMQKWLPPETARSPRLRHADADRGDDEAAQPEDRVRPVAEVEPERGSTPTKPR